MFQESRMVREVVLLSMFKDEETIFRKKPLSPLLTLWNNDVRNLWKFLQSVRRVGKDEVELLFA